MGSIFQEPSEIEVQRLSDEIENYPYEQSKRIIKQVQRLELILNRKCKDDYSIFNQDDENELGEIDEGEERFEEDAAK
jgi:hypothetical protein